MEKGKREMKQGAVAEKVREIRSNDIPPERWARRWKR